MFLTKKVGDFNKKESESFDFTGLKIPRDYRLEKELKDKVGKVLALQRKGAKLIFPDVLSIEQELLK